MIGFIQENLGTIIVGAIVLAIITLIAVKEIKNRLTGKGSCSCGCDSCPGCHGSLAKKKQ